MPGTDTSLEALQKLVSGFNLDVGRVRAGLADEDTPDEAKALLVGALNYVLDSWDMFPDHYPGLGLADDALVLRVSAHLAVDKGSSHRGLAQLSAEADVARTLLGELTEPFERLCASLPARSVKGRTAAAILADANVRALFEADLNRLAKKPPSTKLPSATQDAQAAGELRKMVKSALVKAGFVK